MSRSIIIQRYDGVKQHYTVKFDPRERYVYDRHERAWIKPERGAPPIPPEPPIDVPPIPPPLHKYEVVAYTNVTRGKGKKGLERLELRTIVSATSLADAERLGRERMLGVSDPGYLEFLTGRDIFKHMSVTQVPDSSYETGVSYYRHADGKMLDHKEW